MTDVSSGDNAMPSVSYGKITEIFCSHNFMGANGGWRYTGGGGWRTSGVDHTQTYTYLYVCLDGKGERGILVKTWCDL